MLNIRIIHEKYQKFIACNKLYFIQYRYLEKKNYLLILNYAL